MLVEINLLPQKEQKKLDFLVISAIFICLFILVTVIYYIQIHSTKNTVQSVEKQIDMTKKTEAQLQKKQNLTASTSSVNQLKNSIEWANKNRIETIPVMRHLAALLPERGFIQSFTYNETGTVTLTVQFDTATEAANYLNSLSGSSWIDKASLRSLTIAGATNSEATTGSQTNSAAAPSNPASPFTASTVDSNTNSTTENYLPRYTGQFEIQFNRDSVKKAMEIAKQDGSAEKDGTGS